MTKFQLTFGNSNRDVQIVNRTLHLIENRIGENSHEPFYRELEGSLWSISKFEGTITRMVVMSRNPKKGVTQTKFNALCNLVRSGREPTSIKLSQNQKICVNRRRLDRIEDLASNYSYMEVTFGVDAKDASIFLRKDGCLRSPNAKKKELVRIRCFCEMFLEYGGVCTCSLTYANDNHMLDGGRSLKELRCTKIFAGKKRMGAPLRDQAGIQQSLHVEASPQNWNIFRKESANIYDTLLKQGAERVINFTVAFKIENTASGAEETEGLEIGYVLSPCYQKGTLRLGEKRVKTAEGWVIRFPGSSTADRVVNKQELVVALTYAHYVTALPPKI